MQAGRTPADRKPGGALLGGPPQFRQAQSMPWLPILFLSLVVLGMALFVHVYVERILDADED